MKLIDEFLNTPDIDHKSFREDYALISELLPYRSYDEKTKLFYNKDSIAFLIEVSSLIGSDDSTVNILTNMICDTETVPEGSTIQFMNYASPHIGRQLEAWEYSTRSADPIYQKLASNRVSYIQAMNEDKNIKTPLSARNFRVFISLSIPYGKNISLTEKKLQVTRSKFAQTLQSIGVHTKDLEAVNFINLMGEFFNIGLEKNYNFKAFNPYKPLHQQVTMSNATVEVEGKSLKLNDSYHISTMTPAEYPESWVQYQNAELLGDFFLEYRQISCPFIISYSFIVPDQVKAKRSANFKMAKSIRDAESGFTKWVPQLAKDAQSWRFVADKLRSNQKLVDSTYHLTLFARSEEELENAIQQAKGLYESYGFSLQNERFVQLKNFLMTMPMIPGNGLIKDFQKLGKTEPQVSWTCSNLAPLQGDFKGNDASYKSLPFFSRRGQLFFINPFDNPEGGYNIAVIGNIGSGKSVFLQFIMASFRSMGGKVYIIDQGRSFENSVKIQGGQFVEFTAKNKICINPFSIITPDKYENDSNYKKDANALLVSLVCQMAHETEICSDYEKSAIVKAIDSAWKLKKNKATITTVAEALLIQKGRDGKIDKRVSDLGEMLYPFTKDGVYADYFEGDTSLDINNELMAFELSELNSTKNLQTIVLMIIMFFISEDMYHGGRKQNISLFIDEAWNLLAGSAMSEFIYAYTRTCRKYRANLVTATQTRQDYDANAGSKVAFATANWVMYMKQKDQITIDPDGTNKFELPEYDVRAINSLKKTNYYSESFIKGPMGIAQIGRIIIDPFTLMMFSSKAEHYALIKKLTSDYKMKLENAITRAVKINQLMEKEGLMETEAIARTEEEFKE